MEKAYLKVCNGYNFCGSNTSWDLFIFTGWIPEKIKCDKIHDVDKLWKRMITGEKHWDVMISISTGEIKNEEEIGLVSNHAYAVLELIEIDGLWLLLILNPWWRFSWKG